MKIAKYLEEPGVLIKVVTQTVKNEAKVDFLECY